LPARPIVVHPITREIHKRNHMSNPSPQAAELSASQKAAEPTVPCIICQSPISPLARLCPTCRSYQVRWKNDLSYFGSTAGVAAILASAIAFIGGQSYQAYQLATWKDNVAPVYFEYPGDSGFINSGDGDVVIASIDITWGNAPRQTINIPLNQPVKKGEFVTLSTKSPYGEPHGIEHAAWAKNAAGQLSSRLMSEAVRYPDALRCAEQHFYNRDHLVFKRIDTMEPGKRLAGEPVSADVNFVSMHSGSVVTKPITDLRIAYLFIDGNRPECARKDFDLLE
jgi:hypothetical protein